LFSDWVFIFQMFHAYCRNSAADDEISIDVGLESGQLCESNMCITFLISSLFTLSPEFYSGRTTKLYLTGNYVQLFWEIYIFGTRITVKCWKSVPPLQRNTALILKNNGMLVGDMLCTIVLPACLTSGTVVTTDDTKCKDSKKKKTWNLRVPSKLVRINPPPALEFGLNCWENTSRWLWHIPAK
jgi:hypothetical protein